VIAEYLVACERAYKQMIAPLVDGKALEHEQETYRQSLERDRRENCVILSKSMEWQQ
jgi:hypothetical protein